MLADSWKHYIFTGGGLPQDELTKHYLNYREAEVAAWEAVALSNMNFPKRTINDIW
jgi:hypothetical protein